MEETDGQVPTMAVPEWNAHGQVNKKYCGAIHHPEKDGIVPTRLAGWHQQTKRACEVFPRPTHKFQPIAVILLALSPLCVWYREGMSENPSVREEMPMKELAGWKEYQSTHDYGEKPEYLV